MGNARSRRVTGVYAIRCRTSGNGYVGSSLDVRARWAAHRCELRSGTHHCSALQASWTKHGEEAFLFEVLETCHPEHLLSREQLWLDHGSFVYNSARVVGSPSELNRQIARRHAIEVLAKIPWTEERRAAAKARFAAMERSPISDTTRARMSASAKARTNRIGPWTIRKAKEATSAAA